MVTETAIRGFYQHYRRVMEPLSDWSEVFLPRGPRAERVGEVGSRKLANAGVTQLTLPRAGLRAGPCVPPFRAEMAN